MNADISGYIDLFLDSHDFSPTTFRSYKFELIRLFQKKFLDKDVNLITNDDIRRVLQECKDRDKNSYDALERKKSVLSKFFKFLRIQKIILHDPVLILPEFNQTKNQLFIPSPYQINKILNFYDTRYYKQIYKYRYRLKKDKNNDYLKNKLTKLEHLRQNNTLLLRFIYSTMCKTHELINVRMSDIDFTRDVVTFKDRTVPIDPITMLLIEKINKRRKPDDFLFLTQSKNNIQEKGKKYTSATSIEQRFRLIRVKLGIHEKLTPESLRKAAIRHLRLKKVGLKTIAEILGYKSVHMIDFYSIPEEIDTNKIIQAYSHHPLM